MYLLVFVTIIISLIGIYAEALSLQTARLAAGQTSIAQEMARWHSTAISQARYAGVTPVPTGCDLTTGGPIGTLCNNPTYGGVNIATALPFGWTACPLTAPPPPTACWTQLPASYQANSYTFYSVLYKPVNSPQYVLTFVPPPLTGGANPAPGFVTLPKSGAAGATQLGITMSELFQQIKNNGLLPMAYGMITNVGPGVNALVTQPFLHAGVIAPIQFSLPATLNGAAYVGSIGIISSP